MLNVSFSISQNIGTKFQFNIDAIHAVMVQGGKITSSPLFKSKAPKIATRPEVHELTVIAYFEL